MMTSSRLPPNKRMAIKTQGNVLWNVELMFDSMPRMRSTHFIVGGVKVSTCMEAVHDTNGGKHIMRPGWFFLRTSGFRMREKVEIEVDFEGSSSPLVVVTSCNMDPDERKYYDFKDLTPMEKATHSPEIMMTLDHMRFEGSQAKLPKNVKRIAWNGRPTTVNIPGLVDRVPGAFFSTQEIEMDVGELKAGKMGNTFKGEVVADLQGVESILVESVKLWDMSGSRPRLIE